MDHVHPGSAAEFIVKMAHEHPGKVVVLALAALTNVALALQLDPGLGDVLRNIVVLGGAMRVNGNVNPAAEANVYGDPDAANVVFSRVERCQLLGLDVTHDMEGIFLHDAAAFTAVVHPEYFEWHTGKVLVVSDGPAKGHTIMDGLERPWIGSNAWDDHVPIKVALGVDRHKVLEFVKDRMSQ
eukprot:jgi/Picre1/28040/NNA_001000.t1